MSFGSNANIMASVGDECGFGFGLGGTFRRIYNGFGMLDIDLFLLTSFFLVFGARKEGVFMTCFLDERSDQKINLAMCIPIVDFATVQQSVMRYPRNKARNVRRHHVHVSWFVSFELLTIRWPQRVCVELALWWMILREHLSML